MADLSVVADRLSRAADKLENTLRRATNLGLLHAEHKHERPRVIHGPTGDAIAEFAYPGDADLFALCQPSAVAALVPLLRGWARDVRQSLADTSEYSESVTMHDLAEWDTFAALLLGEEETPASTSEQRWPTDRPGWLGTGQPWPCGRCGREVDDESSHTCVTVSQEETP